MKESHWPPLLSCLLATMGTARPCPGGTAISSVTVKSVPTKLPASCGDSGDPAGGGLAGLKHCRIVAAHGDQDGDIGSVSDRDRLMREDREVPPPPVGTFVVVPTTCEGQRGSKSGWEYNTIIK